MFEQKINHRSNIFHINSTFIKEILSHDNFTLLEKT